MALISMVVTSIVPWPPYRFSGDQVLELVNNTAAFENRAGREHSLEPAAIIPLAIKAMEHQLDEFSEAGRASDGRSRFVHLAPHLVPPRHRTQ
jgi:hypothetical protein